MNSKDGLLALLGLLSILYGLGMAFFTWRLPESQLYRVFKPRWRYGIEASRSAAIAQVPLFLILGIALLLGAFHSQAAQIFGILLIVFAALATCLFFADWISPDEP